MKGRHLRQIIRRLSRIPLGIDGIRYLANHARLLLHARRRSLILPYPNALMLEITNYCQLHCVTCAREHRFGRDMNRGNMDIVKAKAILDEAGVYLDKIALTGLGEPFLYPYLVDLVNYIHGINSGILLFISTNAQAENTLPLFETIAPMIATLQISIDGVADTFAMIRKNADFLLFEETVSGIMKISRREKVEVKLNMVVFEKNYTDMKSVVLFAHTHGISEVYFNSLNLVSHAPLKADYSFYSSDAFTGELREARRLASHHGIALVYPNMTKKNRFATCPYPWKNFSISWDGYLVPCCAKPFPKELHFGNVFEEGLLAAINSDKSQWFRKRAIRNAPPDFCLGCHHVENQ
ncbi:MAG: SPASM domain-containing protein [Chitinispirillaceae bacterium]|nr:SPASM domain-containing protein [Chitinispirillaceae bacterium]